MIPKLNLDKMSHVKKNQEKQKGLGKARIKRKQKRKTPPPSPDYGAFKDIDTSNSPGKPFIKRDSILRTFTLKQLQQNGYIDYDQTSLPTTNISAVFRPGAGPATSPIHRIFKRSNWTGTDDALWETLQPSLQVATRFLNEIGLNHFFQSLIWGPHEDIVHPTLAKKMTRAPRRFGHLDEAERRNKGVWRDHKDTCKALTSMHPLVQFEWGDLGYYAETDDDPNAKDGLSTQVDKSLTVASLVAIDESFKKALSATTHLDRIPFAKRDKFGQEEALLRTRLVLAITLVHEVCHTVFSATVEDSLDDSFYRDHRLAEVGSAFESILFNGSIDSIASNNPFLVPGYYGLSIVRWPGADVAMTIGLTTDQDAEREKMVRRGQVPPPLAPLQIKTAIEANIHYSTYYLLPMTWVRQFFTDEFWDHDAPKSGLNAYHPPRRVGIRGIEIRDRSKLVEISPLPAEQTLPAEHSDDEGGRDGMGRKTEESRKG